MNGLGACCLDGSDDLGNAQVGLEGGRGANADGLVCLLDVQGTRVGLAVDSDGFDAEAFAGADDAACDFTAVGDEDLRLREGEREGGREG